MTNLMNYGGKSLVSAEQAKLDLDTPASSSLSDEQFESVKAWLVEAVDGVKEVQLSTRLTDSPAIVVGHESASMRRMMAMVESGTAPTLPPQTLEINGAHPIITSLAKAKEADPALAKRVADQVFSNALVAAGLLDDPRTMLPNVNAILEEVLSKHKAAPTDAEAAAAKAE